VGSIADFKQIAI